MSIDPRQEWATPSDFYAVIDTEFHPTIDVAAIAQNAKCSTFITPEQNALDENTRWLPEPHRVAWCNPGFADMMPWIQKAVGEAALTPHSLILVLGLVSPSTEWWELALKNAKEIRLIGGKRIQFDPAEGIKRSSNARENALFIFDGRPSSPVVRADEFTWYWYQFRRTGSIE